MRKIKASTDGKSDQKFTRLLRELINSVGSCTPVKVNYFEELRKATEKEGPVEDYPDLFENLNIAEPAKEEKNEEDDEEINEEDDEEKSEDD